MLHCREAFANGQTNRPHSQHVRQAQVAHDGSPHQTSAVVISVDKRGNKQSEAVRPWNRLQLLPEPTHDEGNVETENKRNWDQIVERLAVLGDAFKVPEYSEHTQCNSQILGFKN